MDDFNENDSIDADNIYFHSNEDFAIYMKITKLKNNMTVLHLNVRRLTTVEKFKDVLEFINSLNIKPDFIALSETWLTNDVSNLFTIPGYAHIHVCRDNMSAGLSLYWRSTYVVELIDKDNGDVNVIDVLIKNVNIGSKNLRITAIYMPKKIDSEQLCEKLDEKLALNNHPHIIIGDFNLNVVRPDAKVINYVSLLNCYGYKLLNNFVTRPASNSIIDHVWCNMTTESVTATINTHELSDHACTLTFMKNVKYHEPTEKENRIIKTVDYEKCNEIIEGLMMMNHNFESYGPDDMLSFIYDAINTALKSSTTEKEVSVNKKQKLCPWISRDTKRLAERKKRLLKKTRTANNLKNLRDVESQLKIAKTNDRIAYFERKFSSKNTQRQQWKNLNEILGRDGTKKGGKIEIVTSTSSLLTNPSDVASYLNSEWIKSCKEQVSRLGSGFSSSNPMPNRTVMNSVYLEPVTDQEVLNLIKSFKSKAAQSLDGLNMITIQKCASSLHKPLASLANKCLEMGVYPKKLKHAKVVPVYKGGDRKSAKSYRPISLLSPINKILESLIGRRITSFLDKENVLSKQQYGYQRRTGTSVAVAEIIDHIYEQLDNGKIVSGLFLDLSKAFDTINHRILLKKLFDCGIRGNAYALIESYLTDREQTVTVLNELGLPQKVDMGVPQGSVLGPLLFLIFLNDIHQLPLKGKLVSYADDNSFFYTAKTAEQNATMMQADVNLLTKYFNENQLTVNVNKTAMMHLHTAQRSIDGRRAVFMNGNRILEADCVKFLGIYLDKNMTWKQHVSHLSQKLVATIGVISRLKNLLPLKQKHTIYDSLFLSRIIYCIESWGAAYKSTIKPLQVLQNKMVKIINRLHPRTSSLQLYTTVERSGLPIRALCDFYTVSLMWKMKNGLIKSNINFGVRAQTYSIREPNPIAVPPANINCGQKRFKYRAANLWNQLMNVVDGRNIRKLSISLRNYLGDDNRIVAYLE